MLTMVPDPFHMLRQYRQWTVQNYYDKCAYKGCENTKCLDGKRLFRFPMYKDERLKTWIHNTGNVKLKNLATSTLRRLGLCEDHFLPESFTNVLKTRLNRNAVPIVYENASSSTNNQNVEVNETQTDVTAAPLLNDGDISVKEEQLCEERFLRTYLPAASKFRKSATEEDVAERMRLEPRNQDVVCNSTKRNVECKDDSTQEHDKEKSNLNAKITALKIENFHLRRKIKRLKSKIQKMAQTYKCKNINKKSI